MLENLTLIAALAIIVWIVSFLIYGYSFRNQKNLEGDIQALQDRLDQSN